jgi:hypothetical protein
VYNAGWNNEHAEERRVEPIQLRNQHRRMTREARTIEAMVLIYCHDKHGTRGEALCAPCQELLSYAGLRLDKCPYQEGKTTCVKCPTHCYKPDRRQEVREVMKYAGPRMMLKHPYLAVMHLLVDGRREKPERAAKASRGVAE